MTKMVGKTRGLEGEGGGVNVWASENWSGRVHFEGHSPGWRVLSKLSVQPWDLSESKNFLAEVFQITSRFVLARKKNWGLGAL